MCVGRKFGVRWCVAKRAFGAQWSVAKRKWGQCLGGGVLSLSLSLSLSLLALFTRLWTKFKGLFTHFIVVLSHLIANFSYFIVVLTHLFAYKRHFLGHCAFLKFLNALFVRFCALFVILSLCKKATQRVARRKPQQKNPHKLKENLLFLDTSLALSMTANASLRAVFTKTAWQSINSALFLLFGLPRKFLQNLLA